MRSSIAQDEDGVTPATKAEILITPAPEPWRRWLTLAALALVAVVALRVSLPGASSETHVDPIAPAVASALPPWAPAEPQLTALELGQTNARSDAANVDRPIAYPQFCHNDLSVCDPVTPMPPNPG